MTTRASFANGSTPTALLVHGAFADASSWAGVIAELQSAGVPVSAPANPLRGLASDSAYIKSIVADIDGPVLLVGHSYGGAIITQVGEQAGNVVGLVYVAAFAPAEGESLLDITGRYPDSLLPSALRPASFGSSDAGPRTELYITTERFAAVFAADVPASVTAVSAVAQRPAAAAAFEEKSAAPAWTTRPSWFVVASADQAIHPDAQRFMAHRAGADTIEVDGSHAVAVAQPGAVAAHIRSAALATRHVRASAM